MSIRRDLKDEAFDSKNILAVKICFHNNEFQAEGDDAPAAPMQRAEKEYQPQPPGLTARRAMSFKADVEAAGYSKACPGCRAIVCNLKQQTHSEACRKQVEAFLTTTPEGRDRLERAG